MDSTQRGQTEGPSPGTRCSHSFMLGRVGGQAVPSHGVGERLHNSLISSSFFPTLPWLARVCFQHVDKSVPPAR